MKKILTLTLIVAITSCKSTKYFCQVESKGHGQTQSQGFKISGNTKYKLVFAGDTINLRIEKSK